MGGLDFSCLIDPVHGILRSDLPLIVGESLGWTCEQKKRQLASGDERITIQTSLCLCDGKHARAHTHTLSQPKERVIGTNVLYPQSTDFAGLGEQQLVCLLYCN